MARSNPYCELIFPRYISCEKTYLGPVSLFPARTIEEEKYLRSFVGKILDRNMFDLYRDFQFLFREKVHG